MQIIVCTSCAKCLYMMYMLNYMIRIEIIIYDKDLITLNLGN